MTKLTLRLLPLLMLFAGSNVFAQTTKIDLSLKNVTLKQLIGEIEGKTDYTFMLDNAVNQNQIVSVEAKQSDVNNILNQALDSKKYTYSIVGKQIILKQKQVTEPTKQNAVKVSGIITDKDGKTIPGVGILLKGTNSSSTTDGQGQYNINIPAGTNKPVLLFSCVGFKDHEEVLNNRTDINLSLSEEISDLEEVVVVGYGTQKKASLTGSVSSIKSDEITIAPVASASNALAGRLPGLIVKQNSGLPGSDKADLSIRGFSAPLVIIDGAEGDINTIDPNEIESISVLKDASAAIYGSRAGNGVILVSTKRGSMGKPVITYNGTYTLQNPTNLMRMASAGQYAEMVRESHIQSGQPEATSRFSLEQIEKYYKGDDPDFPNTDWFDYLVRDWTPQQQHNMSLRGGSENVKYYTFFGYLDQESMIKRNGGNYKRYNIRSNIDAKILDNLTLSADISSIISQYRFPWRSDEGNNSVWQDIWNTEPIYPSTLPDPSKIPFANGGGTGGAHISSNRKLSGTRDTDNMSFGAKASLRWDIKQLPGLYAMGTVILDKWYSNWKYFQYLPQTYTYNHKSDIYTLNALALETKLDQSASNGRTITGQMSLNYEQTIEKHHNIKVLALYELIDVGNNWISAGRSGFDSHSIPYLFAGGKKNQISNGSASEMGRSSLIGRINYDYKYKYLLETTLRYDGSANFDPGYRWGLFPSISAGWMISQESFMEWSKKVLSKLKIRGGFSFTGEDRMFGNQARAFPYLAGYEYSNNLYLFGNSAASGLVTTGIPNPLLSWEEMATYNLGLDFALFSNKLIGEFDVFYRKVDGIIARRHQSLPDTFGSILPAENLNSKGTRGFELMLGYRNSISDFKYSVSGNISWSRTKWISFDEPDYTDPDEIRIHKKTGKWVDVMYGYKSDGLFTSQDQIDQLNYLYLEGGNSFLKPGDVRLLDNHGDGILNWKDYVEIGKGSMPHWMGGVNIDLAYKNFDMSALFQGAFGFTNVITLRRGIVYPEVVYRERWSEANNDSKAIVPRLGGAPSNDWGSDYNFISGDYLRLKTLSIGYTLPSKLLNKLKIKNTRVYAAGTNLLTLSAMTKYNLDPEASYGMSGQYYPQMRTITFGVNISL